DRSVCPSDCGPAWDCEPGRADDWPSELAESGLEAPPEQPTSARDVVRARMLRRDDSMSPCLTLCLGEPVGGVAGRRRAQARLLRAARGRPSGRLFTLSRVRATRPEPYDR